MKRDILIQKWKMNSLFSRKKLLLALNKEIFLLISRCPESAQPFINHYQKSIISLKIKIFRNNREFNLKKEINIQILISLVWTNLLCKLSLDQINRSHVQDKVLKILLIKTTWKLTLMFTILKIWFICLMMLKRIILNKVKRGQNSTFLISVLIFKSWFLIICNNSMTRKTVVKFVWIKQMLYKFQIYFRLLRKK